MPLMDIASVEKEFLTEKRKQSINKLERGLKARG